MARSVPTAMSRRGEIPPPCRRPSPHDIINIIPIRLLRYGGWTVEPREIERSAVCEDVPLPIVRLNRWFIVLAGAAALLLRSPLPLTVLLLVLLPATFLGQRWSLIFHLGRALFGERLASAEREDRRLMRFNNAIAVTLLTGAHVFFYLGLPAVGWVLAAMVVAAAAIALAGFCVGCFLYYQFRLNRYRLFGR